MLKYQLLRNHAGILLLGDYETLKDLHQTIHDVNERSPIILNKEGIFLSLAYDIRKAYEGQRKKLAPPEGYPEIGPRFGVEILWPVLLLQSRILRVSMGFIDTDKGAQANAYALEHVIEGALKADFGGDLGASLVDAWMRINPAHPCPEEKLNSRGAFYCSLTKAERKKYIGSVIDSLDSMYPMLYSVWARNGVKNLVAPDQLDKWDTAEWPDPRW